MLYAQIELGASLLQILPPCHNDTTIMSLDISCKSIGTCVYLFFSFSYICQLAIYLLNLVLGVSQCIVDAPHMFNTCCYTAGNTFHSYIFPIVSIVPFVNCVTHSYTLQIGHAQFFLKFLSCSFVSS